MASNVIESGDLYFFYRPKVHEEKVRNLDDVERTCGTRICYPP